MSYRNIISLIPAELTFYIFISIVASNIVWMLTFFGLVYINSVSFVEFFVPKVKKNQLPHLQDNEDILLFNIKAIKCFV